MLLDELQIRGKHIINFANPRNLWQQFQQTRLLLALSTSTVIFAFFAIYLFSNHFNISPDTLTRDSAAVTSTPSYVGILSSLGAILWGVNVAVCMFGYALMPAKLKHLRLFLLCSALFSAMLGIDDLMMLHDGVLSDIMYAELVMYSGYILFAISYIVIFAEDILNTRYLLLAAALGCFGFSMFMDQIFAASEMVTFVEDGFKFMGIIIWTLYFYKTTIEFVRNTLSGQD